jgi:SAM-dependent methyltransferase
MFYGPEVAHSHDVGHGDFAHGAGTWLASVLQPPGVVVELGCGSGISSELLADAGLSVVGVDLSGDLLARARSRVPAGRFERASFLDFPLPAGCQAVTGFSEVFNYLADERVGRDSLRSLFTRVYEALAPGGLLVFDTLEPAVEGGAEPSRSWVEGDDWLICVEVTESGRSLVRRIAAFRSDGDTWRRSDEDHHVLLLPRDEVIADLEAAGFDVEVLDAYGDMAFRPRLTGYAATKR